MPAADLFVYPSFYEGFGIPILEARFSGTPVIASNSSCLDEAGGQGSRYFNPKNSEELADHILLVLAQDNLGIQGLDNLRIEYSVKKLMDIYNE